MNSSSNYKKFSSKKACKAKINIKSSKVYLPLARQLKNFLKTRHAVYGIYLKDLIRKKFLGINDQELFIQASCIKVPYVLFLYEKIASGVYNLEQRLAYQRNTDYSPGSGYLQYIVKEGDRFTLRTLAKIAITLSDNIAYRMIKRLVGYSDVIQYMRNIGGKSPSPDGDSHTTPEDMGCYLEAVLDFCKRESELGKLLLDDLIHPVWHYGLPGLLPDYVKVAHKEGDLEGVVNDVGIILASDHPYILAILSKNQPDVYQGFKDIATISKIIFDYQCSFNKVHNVSN